MANLTKLYLNENKIGDAGMAALSTALGNGALPLLQGLWLTGNQIGDSGMQAFAAAIGSGVLPLLEWLSLSENEIGDTGMAAFATAIASGALPSHQALYVDGVPLRTEHPALKDACGKRGISLP